MIVYHGSVCEITHPDVSRSKRFLDFGRGFYTTTYKAQAERWAVRKAMRSGKTPVVNVYELLENWGNYNVMRFQDNNEAWLDYISDCRRGGERYKNYDIVIGGVANDDVFKTVDMYFRGIWDRERTLKELRYFKKNDQIAIISQSALNELMVFQSSYKVEV